MDPMTYEHLHWRALTASLNFIPPVPTLLQQLLFKTRNPQASPTIEVDVLTGGKYILPFVIPGGPGVIVSKTGRETRMVTAPMIRVKQPYTARELLLERGIGQTQFAGGAGDINSAREARVAREQKYMKDRAERTIEYMAAQALTTGQVSATAGQTRSSAVTTPCNRTWPASSPPVASMASRSTLRATAWPAASWA